VTQVDFTDEVGNEVAVSFDAGIGLERCTKNIDLLVRCRSTAALGRAPQPVAGLSIFTLGGG
jgi:hypothetical protein